MTNVCLEVYRTVVARAEGGVKTHTVRLPSTLPLTAEEQHWLQNVAGVRRFESVLGLPEPEFLDK